jgi:ribulose kinase
MVCIAHMPDAMEAKKKGYDMVVSFPKEGVAAVIEGVAFGLRDGLDLMLAAGLPRPNRIRASGGGIASPLWRSILADVLETDLRQLLSDLVKQGLIDIQP